MEVRGKQVLTGRERAIPGMREISGVLHYLGPNGPRLPCLYKVTELGKYSSVAGTYLARNGNNNRSINQPDMLFSWHLWLAQYASRTPCRRGL